MTQELHNDSPGTDTGVEVGKGEIPHGGSRASLFARIPRVFEHYPGLLARLRTAGALVALSVVLLGGAELGGHYAWGLILFSYLLLVMTAYELVRACSSSPLHLSGLGTAASQTTFFFGLLFTPTVILLCRMSEGSFFEAFRIHAFLPVIGVAGGLSLFSVLLPIVFQSTVSLPVVERRILERVIAVLFVGIGGGAAMALVSAQEAAGLFFWFILVNALNDSGAYFIGARFQSSRLSPVLSPKKTLYGSYGGVMFGSLAALLALPALPLPATVWGWEQWCFFGGGVVGLIFLAQLGDLLQSMIKRAHGIKDMGTVLPGHGGILDRIDGVLLSCPYFLSFYLLLSSAL